MNPYPQTAQHSTQMPPLPHYPPVNPSTHQGQAQQPTAAQPSQQPAGQHQPPVSGGNQPQMEMNAPNFLEGTPQRPPQAQNPEQIKRVDLNEPAPFNQSQLLYNRPLNATVSGNATVDKNKSFIRYADISSQQPVRASPGGQNDVLQRSFQAAHTESAQRPGFDRSLNDREAATWAQTHLQEGLQTSGTNAGKAFPFPQGAADQATASKTPPLRADGVEVPEKRADPKALLGASPGPLHNAVTAGTPAQDPLKKPLTDKFDPSEFQPVGFSNTRTQADILKQGLRPDPANIDLDPKDNAGSSLPAGHALPSQAAKLTQELDGINKYLQGVRVPKTLDGQNQRQTAGSYTLQQLKADDLQMNYQRADLQGPRDQVAQAAMKMNNLYRGAAPAQPNRNLGGGLKLGVDVPPQMGTPSEERYPSKKPSGSNYDIVDETYQCIDDFEQRLQKMSLYR